MTSRRGTLVEEGACELLRFHGYTVRVIPPGFNRKYPWARPGSSASGSSRTGHQQPI